MVKRQKLYVKIYLAVLASIAIFAVATALLWHTLDDREERTGGRFDAMMQLVQNAIPDASLSPEQQQMALEKLNRNLRLNIVLIDPSGAVWRKSAIQCMCRVGVGIKAFRRRWSCDWPMVAWPMFVRRVFWGAGVRPNATAIGRWASRLFPVWGCCSARSR